MTIPKRGTNRASNGLEFSDPKQTRRARTKPTLASIIQQKIATDISKNNFVSGMKLEEEDLARRYDVSRTPVREALRQLAALGIVEMRHRNGVFVTERSAEHFSNLLEVVAELEGAAARFAALRMTDEQRQRLTDLHDEMRTIVEQGTAAQFDKANSLLHQLVHEGAHNDILYGGIVGMRIRTLPYTRVEFISERRRIEQSHMEHYAIVQAIVRREPEAAYHAMRLHVIEAGRAHEDRTRGVSS